MSKEVRVVFTGGDIAWNVDRVCDMDGQCNEKKSAGGSVYYCAIGARAVLCELGVGVVGNIGEVSHAIPTILKLGSQGAIYIENDYSISIPAPAVTAVETTGAGDVLAGTFLALRSADVPIDKALERAVAIASESVTKFGIEHILLYE